MPHPKRDRRSSTAGAGGAGLGSTSRSGGRRNEGGDYSQERSTRYAHPVATMAPLEDCPRTMDALFVLMANLIGIYSLLVFARVLLSWFPQIDWYQQPYRLIHESTEPYLTAFRFIPPLGGMLDISPIIALFVLRIVSNGFLAMADMV